MYFPAVLTASATLPFFAAYIAESDEKRDLESFLAVAYVCAIGLLVSFAAILDDAHDLTGWFGLRTDYGSF